jgi:hypothetical protein
MVEMTSRARALSKKEFRARVDRMIADEERTFGQLLELRDRVIAIVAELDRSDPVAALPSISKIIATPRGFPGGFRHARPARLRGPAKPAHFPTVEARRIA